jgi:hypothetical protein
MSRPTPEERAWAVAHEFRDYLIHDGSTAAFDALVERVTAAVREAEPAAALLPELAELRTLTHDLLIDRDAAYGREVGRGEALATVEAEADRLLGLSKNATAGKHHRSLWHNQWEALVTVLSTLRALGPVRPLPPPERLAARCRALEDALRACVEHCGRYVEREPHEAHFDSYDVDRDAAGHSVERARRLLEENSSDE